MHNSFMQTAIGQGVQSLQPALVWTASRGACSVLGISSGKKKNWKPLKSGEAWSVVSSTFKSLSQVLLRYFGLYKEVYTKLHQLDIFTVREGSWEDGQSLVLWKNYSLCSPWLLKSGKTISVNLIFLKFYFRPICARFEHNDTWGDETTWKDGWAGAVSPQVSGEGTLKTAMYNTKKTQ